MFSKKIFINVVSITILLYSASYASECNLACKNDGTTVNINSNCEISKSVDCRNNNLKLGNNVIVKVKPGVNLLMDLKNNSLKIPSNSKMIFENGSKMECSILKPEIGEFNLTDLKFYGSSYKTKYRVYISKDGGNTFQASSYVPTSSEITYKNIQGISSILDTMGIYSSYSKNFNTNSKRYDTNNYTLIDFGNSKTITKGSINLSRRDSDDDTYRVRVYCDGNQIAKNSHTINLDGKTCQKITVRMYDREENDRVKVRGDIDYTIQISTNKVYTKIEACPDNVSFGDSSCKTSKAVPLNYINSTVLSQIAATVPLEIKSYTFSNIGDSDWNMRRKKGNSYNSTTLRTRTNDGDIRATYKWFPVDTNSRQIVGFEGKMEDIRIMDPDCRSNGAYIGWYNPITNAEMKIRVQNNGSYGWDYRGHDNSLGGAGNFYKLNSFSRGYKQLVVYVKDKNGKNFRWTYSAQSDLPDMVGKIWGSVNFENKTIHIKVWDTSGNLKFDKNFNFPSIPTNGFSLEDMGTLYPTAGNRISCTRGGVPYNKQYNTPKYVKIMLK